MSEALLSPASIQKATSAFANASPVKHVVLQCVCKEDRLRQVFQQALHGLAADLRESDSFKVYQCSDMATLGDDKAELLEVRVLRDALYSTEMREMVANVAQCGALADTVDCCATIYNEGCHLLPHVLRPGKSGRRIAFFLFLTPDEEWSVADGATLDVYDSQAQPGRGSKTFLRGVPGSQI